MSTLSESRRPRLLSQNRKLRHLKGISLRNLAFAPTQLQTTDDTALDRSSPGNSKLQVLREGHGGLLHPSRSSESLRKDSSLRSSSADPRRPPRPRRTSLTLNPALATLSTRQKRLETLLDGTVGDVFYSIHIGGGAEPVYISEVRHRSTNFDFRHFKLASPETDPSITRACILTIRCWAKRPQKTSWMFLLEQKLDLRQLNFIGTLLDRRFPPNALIFHLEDGVYSLDFPNRIAEPKNSASPPVLTSSHSALMKLATLDSSIEDAMETQRKLIDQINDVLAARPSDTSGVAREHALLAEKYVATQQKANRAAEKRREELRESIARRRAAMERGRALQAQGEEDIASNQEKLAAARELADKTEQQIRGQRRRICSELCDIFPITPIPNAPPLSFQICNITVPNSVTDAPAGARRLDENALSAGLGLVTLLVSHLQLYLSDPLPYGLHHFGSRSYARDDISQLSDKQSGPRREFPLYLPRGGSTAGQWRFEYGWFLLNKDIEALCASQGLRVVDIRHSLPNLKYLLYVCSAGSDEVPERKRGGVRGLWAGRLQGRLSTLSAAAASDTAARGHSRNGSLDGDGASQVGSRRGSVDSDMMGHHGDALRDAAWGTNGAPSPFADEPALPFGDGETKLTLRTKGLREDVAR